MTRYLKITQGRYSPALTYDNKPCVIRKKNKWIETDITESMQKKFKLK